MYSLSAFSSIYETPPLETLQLESNQRHTFAAIVVVFNPISLTSCLCLILPTCEVTDLSRSLRQPSHPRHRSPQSMDFPQNSPH